MLITRFTRRETWEKGAALDLEGGQNRRELARIARPRRVLESRSRRASGTVFRPKGAHKTRDSIIVLCEMANRAVAADARRKSVDDRPTPALLAAPSSAGALSERRPRNVIGFRTQSCRSLYSY